VATVGEERNPDARFERAEERAELVVDHLPVVQDPRLVHAIAFVTIRIRDLSAVLRVREQQHVPALELLCRVLESRGQRIGRGVLRQQLVRLEPR